MTQPLNVLFLCTHNSARSIIAECVINRLGNGRFKGFSAGSQPSGRVHPYALQLLDRLNYDTRSLRSKERTKSGSLISNSRAVTRPPRASIISLTPVEMSTKRSSGKRGSIPMTR